MLGNMLDPRPLAGPLVVTIVYVLLYYVAFLRINRTKSRLRRAYADRGEKFDRYFGQDREMLAADRAQLNTLEHMPPFLVLLWLHALFVSPASATVAGTVYLVSRLAHPFVMGARLGRGVKVAILYVTVPGYLVLAYLLAGLVYALVAS